ncbi:hypothetical protein B0T25DRAFT_308160 [Lasiosphaeria hispida]|uniref:Secreted protein n=1 Tax=Lasiosphaeria hispida TaxID=260671 RepID=A0AAJ0H8R0_9PEZI|nr:hypothetical protein B0T25DRAFT_308160 [Lasiosphaeria hispida]
MSSLNCSCVCLRTLTCLVRAAALRNTCHVQPGWRVWCISLDLVKQYTKIRVRCAQCIGFGRSWCSLYQVNVTCCYLRTCAWYQKKIKKLKIWPSPPDATLVLICVLRWLDPGLLAARPELLFDNTANLPFLVQTQMSAFSRGLTGFELYILTTFLSSRKCLVSSAASHVRHVTKPTFCHGGLIKNTIRQTISVVDKSWLNC